MDYVKKITDLLRDVDVEATNYTDDYIPILSIEDDAQYRHRTELLLKALKDKRSEFDKDLQQTAKFPMSYSVRSLAEALIDALTIDYSEWNIPYPRYLEDEQLQGYMEDSEFTAKRRELLVCLGEWMGIIEYYYPRDMEELKKEGNDDPFDKPLKGEEPQPEGLKLPKDIDTELARTVFGKAIEKGWMELLPQGGCKWLDIDGKGGYGSKSRLAYMLREIYTNPGGGKQFPEKALNAFFGEERLGESMRKLDDRRGGKPKGYEKTDSLFQD